MSATLAPAWTGLVDDAAIFPPGDSPLADAVEAHLARRKEWYAELVASFVVKDTLIADLASPLTLSIVVTGGAGAIEPARHLADKHGHQIAGVEIALRDLDDLAGNARRVATAVDAARLDPERSFVEIPPTADHAGWLRAADTVAESGLRLKFRTGGLEDHLFPTSATLAGWIDAALDRETPFKCTAGLHHAVRHDAPLHEGGDGVTHHGFLNVLVATVRAFDGAARSEVEGLLEQRDVSALRDAIDDGDLRRARRWFTSFGSCSVCEPLADLTTLELLEKS